MVLSLALRTMSITRQSSTRKENAMRLLKFFATLLLGVTIGELINEYREMKTSHDMTFWTFLKKYAQTNATITKSSIKEGWQLALAEQPEKLKQLHQDLLFPNLKD